MLKMADVDEQQVKHAVSALFQFESKKKKKDLLADESQKIILQFGFKKIPKLKSKTIKITLPHKLTTDTTDVCLFVKDLDKSNREYELSQDHFRDLLEDKGVTGISEILPLKALKLEYQPFEAKRNLSNMYDVFLADERIVRLLPSLLGKSFYGRKKHPVQVNLQATDLKKEISNAIGNTRCILGGRGSNSSVTVAHTGMPESSVVANIMATVERLADTIPGGGLNIKTVHIKAMQSLAFPIYVSLGSPEEATLPDPPLKPEEDEPEEVTTVENGKVLVLRDGTVEVITDRTARKSLAKKMKLKEYTESVFEKLEPPKKQSKKETVEDKDKEESNGNKKTEVKKTSKKPIERIGAKPKILGKVKGPRSSRSNKVKK